jgi:hypothetical protein
MKKITVFVSILILISLSEGCRSSSKIYGSVGYNTDYLKKIPHLANRIYVKNQGVSADLLFDELSNILLSKNHMTLISDRQSHYIVTETSDAGNATLQRMSFTIEQFNNDSRIKIITEWKSGSKAIGFVFPVAGCSFQPNWLPAQWEKNRLGIAFAESAAIANEIKNGFVSYDIEPSDLPWYDRKRRTHTELASK